jgi:hypothetical protein
MKSAKNEVHFVQHPTIDWEKLNGARIALPSGHGLECNLWRLAVIKPIRSDGFYVLLKTAVGGSAHTSGKEQHGSIVQESLDQATVNKIEDVQSGDSDYHRFARQAGCKFVLPPSV